MAGSRRDGAARRRAGSPSASPSSPSNSESPVMRDTPRLLLRFGIATLAIALAAVTAMLLVPSTHPSVWGPSLWQRQLLLANTKRGFMSANQADADTADEARKNPRVEVLAVYPHDPRAFTQGLLVAEQGMDKFLIESTGLYGESSLRKVDITTGVVQVQYNLTTKLFGEGVTVTANGELVLLTWKRKQGLVLELHPETNDKPAHFDTKRTFTFETITGEGWGIESDGTHLLVSDGSSSILFWDPVTMTEVKRLDVTLRGQAVRYLNELEYVNGFIYANVWYQPVIVKIDPRTGQVVAVFDCSELITQEGANVNDGAVLNGIAYDGDEDVFYVTGKLWSKLFKVRLLE